MRDEAIPKRKHLRRLERIHVDGAPLYFLTVCVRGRRPVLNQASFANILTAALANAVKAHGWMVGRYVIMPDHVHFFATPVGDGARTLSDFMRYWKSSTSAQIHKAASADFAWQREFFDHLVRSDESYEGKWEYVRLNPVRAHLASDASEWPYQGEINALEW